MTYQTTRLYDANGPYTFLSVSGSTVQRLHIAFLMLDRPVCPTDGTNVRYNGEVRLRGGATIHSFQYGNVGAAAWTRGASYGRALGYSGALSQFRFRGGPALPVAQAFTAMAFDLISPVKDPRSLAPSSVKTRSAIPPRSFLPSGQTWYVTDSVDFTLTIDASTPGFTAPTDGSYCLVEMATCSATGVVFCA